MLNKQDLLRTFTGEVLETYEDKNSHIAFRKGTKIAFEEAKPKAKDISQRFYYSGSNSKIPKNMVHEINK